MRIGIIAGNRLLPIVVAKAIKTANPKAKIIAVCFKHETDQTIKKFCDKTYWLDFGKLGQLIKVLKADGVSDWIMAGQVNPLRIFNTFGWDSQLREIADKLDDFRPHTVFTEIISQLEKQGIVFLNSTVFLKDYLAGTGLLNNISPDKSGQTDIDFGVKMISRFVELDAGQTIVVKNRAVISFEGFEGTDKAISRARLAGSGTTVLKFSKANQDMRFDVPVVGIRTLKTLAAIKAKALVLETNRVIILEREQFLAYANKLGISVIGRTKQ